MWTSDPAIRTSWEPTSRGATSIAFQNHYAPDLDIYPGEITLPTVDRVRELCQQHFSNGKPEMCASRSGILGVLACQAWGLSIVQFIQHAALCVQRAFRKIIHHTISMFNTMEAPCRCFILARAHQHWIPVAPEPGCEMPDERLWVECLSDQATEQDFNDLLIFTTWWSRTFIVKKASRFTVNYRLKKSQHNSIDWTLEIVILI